MNVQPSSGGRYDCIVIGAGHNGLVCAAMLARGGRSVLVLEAQRQVGGAALTREFAAGFRVPACAHLVNLLPAELERALALSSHGLKWAAQGLPTTALAPGQAPLTVGLGLPGADAAAYSAYSTSMQRYARALAPVLASVPPRLGTGKWSDYAALARVGWQIRRLGATTCANCCASAA